MLMHNAALGIQSASVLFIFSLFSPLDTTTPAYFKALKKNVSQVSCLFIFVLLSHVSHKCANCLYDVTLS